MIINDSSPAHRLHKILQNITSKSLSYFRMVFCMKGSYTTSKIFFPFHQYLRSSPFFPSLRLTKLIFPNSTSYNSLYMSWSIWGQFRKNWYRKNKGKATKIYSSLVVYIGGSWRQDDFSDQRLLEMQNTWGKWILLYSNIIKCTLIQIWKFHYYVLAYIKTIPWKICSLNAKSSPVIDAWSFSFS